MKKKPSALPAGQVRIIGGQWRGRKLPVPDSPGLRPTTDPVRETLFNWLAPWIVNARCLDCFAGSGALGFEALSRQARQVIFLETERAIVRQLERNLALLSSSHSPDAILLAEIICTDTIAWLAQGRQSATRLSPANTESISPHLSPSCVLHSSLLSLPAWQQYDIVFVDPPFRQQMLTQTLHLLETQGWLADNALIYVECEREQSLPATPVNWRLQREKSAGQVAYRLYSRL